MQEGYVFTSYIRQEFWNYGHQFEGAKFFQVFQIVRKGRPSISARAKKKLQISSIKDRIIQKENGEVLELVLVMPGKYFQIFFALVKCILSAQFWISFLLTTAKRLNESTLFHAQWLFGLWSLQETIFVLTGHLGFVERKRKIYCTVIKCWREVIVLASHHTSIIRSWCCL